MISNNRLQLVITSAFVVILTFRAGNAQIAPVAPPPQAEKPPVAAGGSEAAAGADYQAGPDDLLSITVLEAPELSRTARVSAAGEISIPLVGVFRVNGLATRDIEVLLENQLRKTYMRDPHVSVQVTEMQSHTISVLGSVNKPGTFQIRGARHLLEVLSLAQGLAADAGDTIIVMKGTAAHQVVETNAGQTKTPPVDLSSQPSADFVEVSVKKLLQSTNSDDNVLIYPGDIVKVASAGVIYVAGEVNKPGAFPMNEHEKLTVMRALSLGQGLTRTAAGKDAIIIRTLETGARQELPVNIQDLLKGKSPDIPLQARDIVFVPNSVGKSVAHGTLDALVRMVVLRPY
jgi:polysaccharide biosynthesis/export protein